MKKEWLCKRAGIMTILLVLVCYCGIAQTTVITGYVRDSVTQLPLSNASVSFKGQKGGARTNAQGRFRLPADRQVLTLVISSVGYQTATRHIDTSLHQEWTINLAPSYNNLGTVTVLNKKAKYRNKGNPAVELIRQVIDHKDSNRMEAYSYASYEKYEKLQLSLSRSPGKKVADNKLTHKYQFLFENADSTKMEGKSLFPVYLEETISQNYYRKNPEKTKSIVEGKKRVDYGEFVDMQGVSSFLNRLYQDFNIYDNNISIFTNLFLSPLAELGPTFYMYYIEDTVVADSQKLVRLSFRPRNPNDLLFRGTMWITLDGRYSVQKLRLLVSKSINFNFVREMKIDQDFVRRSDGRYLLSKSDVIADFGITRHGGGVFGERMVSYKDFTTNQPIADSIFKGAPLVIPDDASLRNDSFWLANRHDSLTQAESKVYANVDSLKNMPSFRRLMDWGTLLLAGYKQAGKFEIGPASTFYSFNPVEGFRLRFGGRTTTKLSSRYYSEAYAAYGFKDEKWKYFLSGTYSLNDKSIYSYPQHFVRASFQRDTKIPGQELQFVQEDNFLLSFKRGNNDKWLYNDIFRLQYLREFGDHLSYNFGLKYWKQSPAGTIDYVLNGGAADTLRSITTGEASVEFRWAPHEQFYIGKLYRTPIFNKYPIFTFRYIAGIKGLFGGEYNYHNLGLNIFKRAYLSYLGYSDITLDAGYLIGQLPFPLLQIHHANQSYAYQLNSYNLMNFLEFVSDHYVSVDIDHYFNGFFFNKIPFMKKLKWREVIEAKMLYGGLRAENDPYKTGNPLLKYPLTNGVTETFGLGSQPYIEAGFGIANIFKLVRLDFIKRFTYLDHPDIAKWGIRFRTKFDF